MFNFFKKDEAEASFDPTDIKITDLRTGFIFDYELSSWEVTESYSYKWENGKTAKEFKIKSSFETLFLSIEEEDAIVLTLMEKIEPETLISGFHKFMKDSDVPPSQFQFQNEMFELLNDQAGIFKDLEKGEEDEFISWNYQAKKTGTIVEIEQWDDDEFEAAIGREIDLHLITNIIPGKA